MKPVKIMLLVLFAAFCRSSLACKCSGYFDRPMQLEDLKDYDFIALVRVTGEHDIKSSSQTMTWSQSLLNIEILEQFKGEKFKQIIENGVNSSCNMGVDTGEEWVVFATLVDGTPAVSPCRRNVQFKAKDGQRDWQFQQGFRQLSELRSLYGHPTKPKSDGIYLEHYPSGKVELEEHYVNGLKW